MTKGTLNSRLEFAQWTIDKVVPLVRARGEHLPAGVNGPTRWRLDTCGLTIVVAWNALLAPNDRNASCLVDVWPTTRPKVLSIRWEPERPWQPPRVIRHVQGEWSRTLAALIDEPAA